MLNKLANLDRRWIFLFVAIAVIVPLIFPLNLPTEPSEPVKNIYNFIEKMPEGSIVLLSFEFGPSTKIEIEPMALSVSRQLFKKNDRIVAIALWPEGVTMARGILSRTAEEYNKTYGKDYVNLGYKAGGPILLLSLAKGFKEQFPFDADHKPVDLFPLMGEVENYDNIALIVSFSAGNPGLTNYIQIVNTKFNKVVAGGCTAVSAPEMYPFLNSGQLLGLMGGLKGAAEYEKLINHPGEATKGMDPQSIVHLLIVLFIIFSNVIYFVEKSRQPRE